MKFKFNEYKKQITQEELINDLKRVVEERNLMSLSMKEYNDYGFFNPSTIIRKFGTWNNALNLAGIKLNNKQFTETGKCTIILF